MGDQDQSGAAFGIEFKQQGDDAGAGGGIEIAGGLIGEQYRGRHGEGAGDGHALLFATGELTRVMLQARFQAHALQQLCRPTRGILNARQLQRQHDVLQGGQAGQKLEGLEHETRLRRAQPRPAILVQVIEAFPRQLDATRRGQVQPGQQTEQRGLARAGDTDNGDTLPACHTEIHLAQDFQGAGGRADLLTYPLCGNNRRFARSILHAQTDCLSSLVVPDFVRHRRHAAGAG